LRPPARLGAAACCACLALALGACGSSSSSKSQSRAIPPDFLGLISNEDFNETGALQAKTLAAQRAAGVELIRQDFDYATIEPRPGVFRWAHFDGYMAAMARAGMHVLAILNGADTVTEAPPRDMARFASFAAAVAARYGPGGSFWHSHPSLRAVPIRSWEIWNEPNFDGYWGGHPSAAGYGAMLRAVAPAIRAVDPQAEIVTAGIANASVGGINVVTYLDELLALRPRLPFNTLAIHAYSTSSAGVIEGVELVRQILDKAGLESTPIWLTEFGWASGGPASPFTVGAKGQAVDIKKAIVGLAGRRASLGVRGIVYYDWRDLPIYPGGGANPWGFHTGLLTITGAAKPALAAYREAADVARSLH
jgi:hypothetical protein